MRAAVYRSFGGPEVVQVEELPKPVPGAGEVLVRVHASTVSVGDYRMRSRDLPRGLATVTSAPAALIGLGDRGRIAPGLRADLVRVRLVDGYPAVTGIWAGGRRIL